jgi:mRNA-degrading endonuclease toxin of MazEF toxin-antitoxin module
MLLTLPCDKIGKRIGPLDDDLMTRISRALALWLGIA